jgi:uncharacterized protein (DUF2384 family)
MNKEEVLLYGFSVFGDDKKFKRWLTEINISLGGVTPESLLDTEEGLELVKNCLGRIEYGNFA